MTSPPEPKSPRRAPARFLAAAVLALGATAWIGACSSTETVAFSDGACVAGGCQHGTTTTTPTTSSSSTGGPCMVDTNCAVHWGTDVFTGILDTQTAGCTSTGLCHGSGGGNLTLTSGDAHGAYTALTGLTLAASPGPAKKYIVPCDKGGSGMLCNLKVDSNPFGTCGNAMPVVGSLTMDQLNTIADWIACGAPEN